MRNIESILYILECLLTDEKIFFTDGNPVTGIGYGESQNNGPAVQNGTTSSNSSEKSNDTSPAAKVPARTRVPPGGYSSGLW